jgi:hypothetical protein
VYADGVILGSLSVSVYDLDGTGGVNALDLSIALDDMHSGQYRARSDFDSNGVIDARDLSRLYGVILSRGSTASGAANCGP